MATPLGMLLNSGRGDDGRKEGAVELTHVLEATLIKILQITHMSCVTVCMNLLYDQVEPHILYMAHKKGSHCKVSKEICQYVSG